MSKTIVTTDTPVMGTPDEVIHTLSILVNNKAGVLMRIPTHMIWRVKSSRVLATLT